MGGGITPSNEQRSPQANESRVVVLAPPRAVTPAVLLRALGRKGLACCVVSDLPEVMAEVGVMPAKAVVVCEPQAWPGIADLAHALAVYFPATLRWGYRREGSGPRLQPLETCGSAAAPSRDAAKSSEREQPGDTQTQSRTESSEADRATGGSFPTLASVVEQATEEAGGPRLRLAGGDMEPSQLPAAAAAAAYRQHGSSRGGRIRAARTRRRLADIVHGVVRAEASTDTSVATTQASQPTAASPESCCAHRAAAGAPAEDEPLITQEELAMLLGSPEPASTAASNQAASGSTAFTRRPKNEEPPGTRPRESAAGRERTGQGKREP